MFFSRSRTPSYGTDAQSSNYLLGTPVRQAFHYMKKPIDKLNVVKELIDLKVKKPVEQDFTQEVMVTLCIFHQYSNVKGYHIYSVKCSVE